MMHRGDARAAVLRVAARISSPVACGRVCEFIRCARGCVHGTARARAGGNDLPVANEGAT